MNEKLITQYLLGELSEEEQATVENRAFSDEDFLQEVLGIENDLIDEYVRGELSALERQQFERRFITSAERRNKIEFARALMVAAPSPRTEAKVSVVPSLKDAFNEFLAMLNPFVKLSMAAAGVIAAAGLLWLITVTVRMRSELAALRSAEQARANQIRELERRNQELALQVDGQQQKATDKNDTTPKATPPGIERIEKPASSMTVASLLLVPGLPRSSVNRPKLVLEPNTSLARVQVGIEPGDEYQAYRVEVRTRGGQEVWTQNGLRAFQSRQGKSVVVNIPARLMETGEFEAALKGLTGKGAGENIGYYYFDVLKK